MKAKKEFILLILVIIAVSLYLIFRSTDKTHYQLPNIPEIEKKEITKIEISKADASITLDKRDDKWLIAPKEFPADTGKVNDMIQVISGLSLSALVSEAKSDYLYDLTEDKRVIVKAWAGDSLRREFEMGRTAPSWHHTFVRLAGDTRVYHAEGNFRDKFDLTVDKLRDKVVLSFEKDEIGEIAITKGTQTLVLTRKETPVESGDQDKDAEKSTPGPAKTETTWENPDGDRADESTVKSMLSSLSKLSCDGYVEDKEKGSFTEPVYAIKLKGVHEYALSIFDKADEKADKYPAVSSANDYLFLLSKWQAERIMKDPGEILKKEEEK